MFESTAGGATVHYLVYCLEQLPGRSVSFEEVRDEIDGGLGDKPLSRIETNAYTLRWRGAGVKDWLLWTAMAVVFIPALMVVLLVR